MIKIIEGFNTNDLEKKVNNFLTSESFKELINIEYSVVPNPSIDIHTFNYSVMIFYRP